jgi:hypothetical protein
LAGGVAAALLVATGLALAPGPASAAGLSIGGHVFHDMDADGHRDAGEPGLPGIRVQHSDGELGLTVVTDADGRYRLDDLPNTGRLLLQTGWFKSQCYAAENLNCPAGPGDDNDFPTRNQLFEYPLANAASTDDLNAALLPDWPGPGLTPPDPVDGVTAANPVDVAARLSAAPDTCSADAFGICAAGDTIERSGQLHNQGTRPITGLRAKVQVPPGDCLTHIGVVQVATSDGVGPMTANPPEDRFSCDTRAVELAFGGTLVPGGAIRLNIASTVRSGPGTPGCTLDAPPAATCSSQAPQGRTLMLGVTSIAEHGDPDSGFCARGDLRGCATGLHDKRREPDEVDPAGHNVDAALGGTTDFNLGMAYARVGRALPVAHAGEEITVRGWVRNEIAGAPTNQAHPGATVRFHFPAGTEVTGLPTPHALYDCAADDPGPSVTCVYNSPLAPHVGSVALNVVVRIPADWPPGRPYRSVACAAPVAGQAGERVPASGQPCDIRSWPLLTPTDNDDDLLLVVLPAPHG